jgi:UDP-N-acetylglucosamine acyltransferase
MGVDKTVIVDDSNGPIYIGQNACVGAFTVLTGPLTIEDRVMIGSHCSIGVPAEHRYSPTNHDQNIRIGADSVIRERTVIQRGTVGGLGTVIGERAYIMGCCQISHDTILEDDVTMASMSVLGGHSYIMKGAYLGIHSCTHPWVVVGSYALLGMGGVAVAHLTPGKKHLGVPAKEVSMNSLGLERAEVSPEDFDKELMFFGDLCRGRLAR